MTGSNWEKITDSIIIPEGDLYTKIDDEDGVRNVCTLTFKSGRWWTGNMYIYYQPTHWMFPPEYDNNKKAVIYTSCFISLVEKYFCTACLCQNHLPPHMCDPGCEKNILQGKVLYTLSRIKEFS